MIRRRPAAPRAILGAPHSLVRAHSAAPNALRHDNFIPQPNFVRIHSRGRLPHWEIDRAVYFVTFRLRDALPREVAQSLLLERDHMLRDVATSADRARLDHAFGIRLDHELDQGYGSCILREHAETVANALKHFDRSR